jgi:asparagine synthase (glutamine-hydrolysing)
MPAEHESHELRLTKLPHRYRRDVAFAFSGGTIIRAMCGIAGAVGAIDDSLEASVRLMMDAQAHRGPDDSGFYRSPPADDHAGVIFGFRRLAILDLSPEGHQPMIDRERQNVVVFNGEIYNYVELRKDLETAGEAFRSTGDTEVLLRACGRWSDATLDRLRGMYAFAFYDRASRQVLLARDRLGIKPLYYATVKRPAGTALLFASELRALLATGLFERHLDPRALSTYLWNGFVVGPATAVKGISLLPPGSSLSVALGAAPGAPKRYWSLAGRQAVHDRGAVALENELLTAARQHLASDVPLGVFLSGGVDSSAVTALAVRAGSERIKTFHIAFEETAFNEAAYARQIAAALGTEHQEFMLTQARFRADLDRALASLDQPTFDGINTYFVSRVVREAGFTVALAGTGGDELFGGYRSFRDLPASQLLTRALRFAPRAALEAATRLAVRLKTGKPGEVAPQTRWGKLPDLLGAGGDLVGLYQTAYGLYTRDFFEELGGRASDEVISGLPRERIGELAEATESATPLKSVSRLELALFIGERLLRDTDVASMAASLEVRVPLLDHRVVEAAGSVPDRTRFRPLGKKTLLKTLAMPHVNPAIFERPKAGFVLPIEVWAKDQLAGRIDALFAEKELVRSVGMNGDALNRLWRSFRAGAPGLYWSRIWAPFVLLDWCQRQKVALG